MHYDEAAILALESGVSAKEREMDCMGGLQLYPSECRLASPLASPRLCVASRLPSPLASPLASLASCARAPLLRLAVGCKLLYSSGWFGEPTEETADYDEDGDDMMGEDGALPDDGVWPSRLALRHALGPALAPSPRAHPAAAHPAAAHPAAAHQPAAHQPAAHQPAAHRAAHPLACPRIPPRAEPPIVWPHIAQPPRSSTFAPHPIVNMARALERRLRESGASDASFSSDKAKMRNLWAICMFYSRKLTSVSIASLARAPRLAREHRTRTQPCAPDCKYSNTSHATPLRAPRATRATRSKQVAVATTGPLAASKANVPDCILPDYTTINDKITLAKIVLTNPVLCPTKNDAIMSLQIRRR